MSPIYITSLLLLATVIYSSIVILSQHRTIDRLTDKLMARDYREYVGLKREEVDVSPPEEQEEKKGWFDH